MHRSTVLEARPVKTIVAPASLRASMTWWSFSAPGLDDGGDALFQAHPRRRGREKRRRP